MARLVLSTAAVLALALPAAAQPPAPFDVPPAVPVGGWAAPDGLPPLVNGPRWGPCGDPCDPCGPAAGCGAGDFPLDPLGSRRNRFRGGAHGETWVRGDWLYWDFRKTPVPVLVATGNPNRPDAAFPGRGNLTPLGAGPVDAGMFSGARVTIGRWFDPDAELGFELSGFVFGREGTAAFFSDASGTPVVSSPVTGVNGQPAAFDFAFPNRFTGSLGVRTATQLYSAEASFLHRWYGDGCLSFDTSLGYRFLQLNERVDLLGRSTPTGAAGTFNGAILPRGVTVFTRDSFRGTTEFHGAQLGGRVEVRRDMFTVTAFGKGGLGANLQTLRVDGSTTAQGFGVTRTTFGGVRALPTNFGRDTNTEFAGIGETGIELGFQVTKNVSLRVGYNLLYWSNVLRPGDAIDQTVNFTQVPIDPGFAAGGRVGAARPATLFRSSDFLAHGLTLGMLLEY